MRWDPQILSWARFHCGPISADTRIIGTQIGLPSSNRGKGHTVWPGTETPGLVPARHADGTDLRPNSALGGLGRSMAPSARRAGMESAAPIPSFLSCRGGIPSESTANRDGYLIVQASGLTPETSGGARLSRCRRAGGGCGRAGKRVGKWVGEQPAQLPIRCPRATCRLHVPCCRIAARKLLLVSFVRAMGCLILQGQACGSLRNTRQVSSDHCYHSRYCYVCGVRGALQR